VRKESWHDRTVLPQTLAGADLPNRETAPLAAWKKVPMYFIVFSQTFLTNVSVFEAPSSDL
jgi:hypothetical protein